MNYPNLDYLWYEYQLLCVEAQHIRGDVHDLITGENDTTLSVDASYSLGMLRGYAMANEITSSDLVEILLRWYESHK